jgi:diguanylate cyclase (GGDEF)-like protein/PAS domain S-box-containing protein
VSFIDLLHTLAYNGMGVFGNGNDANLPTQLWIAARYLQSISLLISPLFLHRRLNARWGIGCFAILTALIVGTIFTGYFPDCYLNGLTPFKIISEYIIVVILLVVITWLLYRKKLFAEHVFKMIMGALVFTAAAEVAFTSYASVYGFANFLGHMFKIVATIFIYAAIIDEGLNKPFNLLFRDLKQRESMLQQQREEQRIIFDSIPAWVFYKNRENQFVWVNKTFADAAGMNPQELAGKSLFDMYPRELAEGYWKDDLYVIASGKPKRNIIETSETKEGTRWVETDKIPYYDAEGNIIGVIGFAVDITERKKIQDQLREAATHDPLTGLPNRLLFQDRLAQALETVHRSNYTQENNLIGVAVLDADNFKSINDTYGHAIGDAVLVQMAQRMKDVLRQRDTVSRLGGDEFAMILENIKLPQNAERIAQKILNAVAKPMTVEGKELALTASLGICLFPAEGVSEESILHCADMAMYKAKEKRNDFKIFECNTLS